MKTKRQFQVKKKKKNHDNLTIHISDIKKKKKIFLRAKRNARESNIFKKDNAEILHILKQN